MIQERGLSTPVRGAAAILVGVVLWLGVDSFLDSSYVGLGYSKLHSCGG